ncbi:MAG: hypothetical protein APF84_00590 [Gracilibacter sp. BRH_c7a]|nr:MAG: hypothetical protein APF84_00590 [Gracilibacter sp. BRH_c7a]
MLILYKMLVVLALLVFLLRRKTQFGSAMLAATLLLFILTIPETSLLFQAASNTVLNPGSWFMMLTLYFVMCLEYILRTSGILKNFTTSARKIFGSDRVLLGFMPAFLGFLPSLGGAIFSAPLVKQAGDRYKLSPERMSAINYWFRHIWEFTNPILPAILLASQITRIPAGSLIAQLFIFTLAATAIGILVLLTGKAYRASEADKKDLLVFPDKISEDNLFTNNFEGKESDIPSSMIYRSILLAAGPIFINILLVVVFNMNTALALGLVLAGMSLILRLNIVQVKKMFVSSFTLSIQWAVLNILFFQEMLFVTGSIDQIVLVFESSGIPVIAIISITAFVIGLLAGSLQGFVAVAFPLIFPLAQNNMDVIAMSYVAGVFGTMSSPSHLCLIVTIEYFKSDFVKTLLPIIVMEILMVIFTVFYIYMF